MSEEVPPNDNDPQLLGNLGSDPSTIEAGEIDMRRFGVFDKEDSAILIYSKFREDSLFWRTLRDEMMNLSRGIGGRGSRDAIRGESVRRGGPANVEAEIVKPGWVERHITNRDWEQDEKKRLGIDAQ